MALRWDATAMPYLLWEQFLLEGRVRCGDVPRDVTTGETTFIPDHPLEGTLRGGHIPGAVNVPWATAARPDGRFRPRAELDALYRDQREIAQDDDVIVYCRIGERSAHTWFVLTHLLGFQNVRNYDGSWAEWGNLVRVPIALGAD